MEGAKTAFDFSFGLWAGRDQMRDAQGGEGTLELRPWIAVVARGLMAKQGQAIGVDRHRQAVAGEGGGLPQPGGAQTKEVRPADAQELGGGVRVKVAAVESVERLVEER